MDICVELTDSVTMWEKDKYMCKHQTTYQDNIFIAAYAADSTDGGGSYKLLLLLFLALVLLLGGLIALVGTGVALGFFVVGHHVDQPLQRRAELTFLVLLEAVVQSFIDHNGE